MKHRKRKELNGMEATLTKETMEFRKQREEFFRELDKGIRDMEQGNVMSHEEAMKSIYEELGLPYVQA